MLNTQQSDSLIENLPEGYRNYLKISLDPYHDRTIRFKGAPTSRSATSVTLCYNQEQTYSADDFGITTGDSWDAHFAMFPFLSSHNVSFATNNSNRGETQVNIFSNGTMRPMTVHGVPSGTPTFSIATSSQQMQLLGLDLSSLTTFISNNDADFPIGFRTLRLVGIAFEVIDESPDIYQQGAVTVYRYPLDVQPSGQNFVTLVAPSGTGNAFGPYPATDTTTLRTHQTVYNLRMPPSNTASAVLVDGSETWKAREGAYCVATQYDSEVPFKQVDWIPIGFNGLIPSTLPTNFGGYYRFYDTTIAASMFQAGVQTPGDTPETLWPLADAVFPFNQSGAYFTGLSRQFGALRLRFRAYVEVLTDPSDNTLAPLAQPTLPYNQVLQEFVMQMLADQPAGVPQSWNPDGEHWRNILHKIGKVAEKLGPALATVSPEVGLIVGAGGTLLRRSTNSKKKSKIIPGVNSAFTKDQKIPNKPPALPPRPKAKPGDKKRMS